MSESSEQTPQTPPERKPTQAPKKISRRHFLKLTGAAAAGAALSGLPIPPEPTQAAPPVPPPETKEQPAEKAGLLVADLGPKTFAGIDPIIKETFPNVYKQIEKYYGKHGEKVTETIARVNAYYGTRFAFAYNEAPANAFTNLTITPKVDPKGYTYTFTAQLNPEYLTAQIKANKPAVVSLSLQMEGGIQVKMPEDETISPIIQPIDAYGKQGNPEKALAKLAEVANETRTIIVAAAGNPTMFGGKPDLTAARRKLNEEGKYSDYLFLIGYEGSGRGFDYGVRRKDLETLNVQPATSLATPIVADFINKASVYLQAQGKKATPENIRNELDKVTIPNTGTEQGQEKLLDLEKMASRVETVYKPYLPREQKERARQTIEDVLIDFWDEKELLDKKALEKNYFLQLPSEEELAARLGLKFPLTLDKLKTVSPPAEITDKLALAVYMANKSREQFSATPQQEEEWGRQIDEQFRKEISSPRRISAQTGVKDVLFKEDPLEGDVRITFTLGLTPPLQKKLSRLPPNSVIATEAQLGYYEVELDMHTWRDTYELILGKVDLGGENTLEFTSPYTSGKNTPITSKQLQNLLDSAETQADKVFVLQDGIDEEISGYLKQDSALGNNVIFVGSGDSEIFVNRIEFAEKGLPIVGSTVRFVQKLTQYLLAEGFSPQEVVFRLRAFCDIIETDGRTVFQLSPEKIIAHFQPRIAQEEPAITRYSKTHLLPK